MRLARIVIARIRSLIRGRALDRDLHDQIAAHLEEASEEFERQGLSSEQARLAARRSFGGVLHMQDLHRDVRSFGWLEDARRDLRYAVRTLWRSPGFAGVAILTMALAIGAATALFSVIDAALLRPVPYPNPEEIVYITVGDSPEMRMAPSATDIESWRTDTAVFTRVGMGRMSGGFRPLIVDAGTPERLVVGTASEELLEVFGIAPIIGRALTIDDRRPGSAPVALLGHRYWQQRFNGSRDVLGRPLRVDGDTLTIVGVVPPGFYADTAVWRPHVVPAPAHAMRGTGTPVYGRLRAGLDIETAGRELTARVSAAEDNPKLRVWLTSLYDDTTDSYGRTIAVLSGAVVLIVLIACVNVASLLFARGTVRESELAIRKSIGASRGRLVRQLLAESALLAVAGGVAGVAVAWATLDVIIGFIPLRLPANVSPAVNSQVLASALMLSTLTAMAFGLAPAIKSSSANARMFASAGRARHGSSLTPRGGRLLIAVEVAMALVLVAAAALMIRSVSKMLAIEVGFEPDGMYTMEVVPVERDAAALRAYYVTLLQNVRQIPGIAAAGGAERPPLDGSGSYTSASSNGRSTFVAVRGVMPGYFEAVGLPLLQGRFPADVDYSANPPFAVLSGSAARAMFAEEPPVGQQFTLNRRSWIVLGVVADAQNRTVLPDGRDPRPDLYLAYQPDPRSSFGASLTLVVRPAGGIPQLAEQLRNAALGVGPSVIVGPLRSGRDWFGDSIEEPTQQMTMLSVLGGLGLLLTLIGIFATTAYAVARRTREVGLRMALGARPGQVVVAIVGEAAWPVALGLAMGLAGAVATTRVIATYLYETTPTDPLTLAVTVLSLALTALMAAWIPARRAAHVDPVAALRTD